MEYNNLLLLSISVVAVVAIIVSIVFASKVAELKAIIAESQDDLANANNSCALVSSKMRAQEKQIAQLSDEKAALAKDIQVKDIKIASLQSKIDVLYNENKKLLVAASDDVTINVKAADDAKIVSENPKPKRRFYKKKSTGGPKKLDK